MSLRNLRLPVKLSIVVAAGLLTLSACSGDTDGPSGAGSEDKAASDTAGLQDVQADSGVPEECLEAFPVAIGEADLADLSLVPGDWPEGPVDATLCQTSSTIEGNLETADYATEATGAEVLDAFQAALPAGYEATREDKGQGDVLTGSAGEVFFQVSTRDGAYTVTFGTD
jgi:hypothetical protein